MPIHYPPMDSMRDLERVLIDEQTLARRVAELGAEITRDYGGKMPVLVSVLKGGIVFLADLIRTVNIEHEIELVGASSYKGGTIPTAVRITKDVDQSLSGRHVILVEDIYDTGRTMRVAYELLKLHNPASLEVCALLNKPTTHQVEMSLRYVGFEIDDVFVVGYGLDFKERYRNLPCIGVLKSELYQ